ncbi:MAG: FtsX-like permease family protein [Candidatus Dadabacteria bacterium]|nr:FtsX-like permease family protein [Candidatus Dadabacteria bacterium]NIQ14341.1 FtsX-like permease family protein [Candidatus Dadabacteria bacterium]
MSYESLISLRYLRSKKKQRIVSVIGLISILGVFLGVMALNVVLSVMKGFEEELRDKILGVSSHLVVMSYDGNFEKYKELREEILDYPGIKGASPFIYNQGMLVVENNVSGSVVRGIDPDNVATVSNIEWAVGRGIFLGDNEDKKLLQETGREIIKKLKGKTASGKPPIIVGKELSNALGVLIGDTINLVSPFGKVGPFGPLAKTRKFELIGIFDYGMLEYDSSISYVHINDAMNFFELENKVTGIEIKVENIYQAKKIGEDLGELLGFPFYTRNWEDVNRSLFKALRLERMAIAIFLGFIILVAALNIVSTLTMLVMEKNKDIAILRAMGAKKSGVRKIFIYDGMIIGAIGTLLGTVFGYLLCYFLKTSNFVKDLIPFDNKVYPISEFPVKIEPHYFVIVAICSLLICFIATIYPSYQASRKDPVEALRYE